MIRSFADLKSVYGNGGHGLVLYVQKPWALNGGIEPIQSWYDDGLRVFQIVYGTPSQKIAPGDELGFGTGPDDPEDEKAGLTDLGRKVVAELNRLGIVVDVSHCNEQTTLDTVRLSKTPVVSSHAGCAALVPKVRNKSDAEIRAIAQSGGIFGVTAIGWMLNEDRSKASIDDFVTHLEHAIKIAGIDDTAAN